MEEGRREQRDGSENETEAESVYVPCCPEIQSVVTGGSEGGREKEKEGVRQAWAKLFYGGE